MKVKLGQAVKLFFGNSSLEMVYFEAIANSLDAGATEIKINISAKSFSQSESLEIIISDNGTGFTDEKYSKFSKLFDVDEGSHKGLGRLVYLCYFGKISVISYFDETKSRVFDFTEGFDEQDSVISIVEKRPSGTILQMSDYTLTRLKSYEFVKPKYLKNKILQEFYSRLFQLKQESKQVNIVIETVVEGKKWNEILNNEDIPEFEFIEIESSINLIDKFFLHYYIKEVHPDDTSLVAAVSVDNRTIKVEIIAQENVPIGYNMVFLLFSDWFRGKVDSSRQNLTISETEYNSIETIFRREVAALIETKIPNIKDRNRETKNNLIDKFPHLSGYFNAETVGYSSRSEVLKKAQDQFFKAQKEILEANSLTEEQFVKSLELSSRALTEYILFRQITIDRLKNTTKKDSEADIHNLFVTMKSQFNGTGVADDLYRNNAWLLDDKYMTYEAVLSDQEMGVLIDYITKEENSQRDDDRPDIALVFSNNPDLVQKFDVVIVELKKRGLSIEDNIKAITQLEKRARKLMKYYNNKIQRIWYYGIIEFNEEMELALTGEYQELYSSGKMYYRETKVAIQKNPDLILPIGVYIWDLNSLINDANSRNSAFLNLIKNKFLDS